MSCTWQVPSSTWHDRKKQALKGELRSAHPMYRHQGVMAIPRRRSSKPWLHAQFLVEQYFHIHGEPQPRTYEVHVDHVTVTQVWHWAKKHYEVFFGKPAQPPPPAQPADPGQEGAPSQPIPAAEATCKMPCGETTFRRVWFETLGKPNREGVTYRVRKYKGVSSKCSRCSVLRRLYVQSKTRAEAVSGA